MERTIGFLVLFTLFLSACAFLTSGAYLYGKGNPDFTFHQSQLIYVALPEPATAEDKVFHTLLIGEMKRLGFRVTTQLFQEALILFFALNRNSNAIMAPLPGNAAISRLPGQWYEVFLELFSLNYIDAHGPVWSGHLKVRRSEFQTNPAGAVAPLLELVGKNYEGPISAQAYSESQPRMAKGKLAQQQQVQIRTLEQRIGKLESEQAKTVESTSSPASQAKISHTVLELKDACIKGITQACITLAELYLKGSEVPADPQRAAQLYEQACAGQNGKACTNFGLLYYQGIGVPKDPRRAKALFRQGCRLNDKMGCALPEGIN
jgi:Sel1 repeat-containing protein